MRWMFFIFGFALGALAQNIHIPDPILKGSLVAQADQDNDGEISEAEAQAVLELRILEPGIMAYTGLEAFENATFLWVRNIVVPSIPEIGALTSLETLWINDGDFNSLPDLSSLENLCFISISSTKLDNLPPLDALPNLIQIRLTNNAFTSFPVIYSDSLRLLNIRYEALIEFPDIIGLPSLGQMDLTGCGLTEMPDISYHPQLFCLDLSENAFGPDYDATLLPDTLLALSFENNGLREMIDVSNLPILKRITFWANEISELDPTKLPTSIERIFFDHNQLTRLPSFEALPNLRELRVNYNFISDIEDAFGVPNDIFISGKFNLLGEDDCGHINNARHADYRPQGREIAFPRSLPLWEQEEGRLTYLIEMVNNPNWTYAIRCF